MRKKSTYIVINSILLSKFKKIPAFKINLGMALTSRNMHRFMPDDINIQKHYLFFNSIINMCGYIGSLPVYTNTAINNDIIILYNEKDYLEYIIDSNMNIYDNLNQGLNLFFDKIGLTIKPASITKDEEIVIETTYIKPDKPLANMTMEERMIYLRSQK